MWRVDKAVLTVAKRFILYLACDFSYFLSYATNDYSSSP